MLAILTAEGIPLRQIEQMARPRDRTRGHSFYSAGLARVQAVETNQAIISVADPDLPQAAQVRARLTGNQYTATCSCQGPYGWSTCAHMLAAAYALRDQLQREPIAVWRAVMSQVAQPQAARAPRAGAALIFSLQQAGQGWHAAVYSLAGRHLPVGHRGDPDTLAAAIAARQLQHEARPLYGSLSSDSYGEMPREAVAAATLISRGGYYAWGNPQLDTVFGMFRHCLVYRGTAQEPFARRVHVSAAPGQIELEVNRAGAAIEVTGAIRSGDRLVPLRSGEVHTMLPGPLWVLIDNTLLPIEEGANLLESLRAYPQLLVPERDQEEFFEQYLIPAAEQVAVGGDMLRWEEVAARAEPQIYLGDRGGELLAELRFAYGDYVLPYEKRLPARSTRRRPGETVLARITRDPAAEQAAWESLGEFGLKRGERPAEFLLRRNVHPADFLMHQVPKLAAAGYTVFGEEALTVARVNRNPPRISFHVSSGIDWFDVLPVIQYGDQTVGLKELRRALRRRERYLKLADGSLGLIPEEWAERYRHLFGLAEEHGDGLRLSNHHVALLDPLLDEADRARAGAAFRERLDALRSFERIEPAPLPRGLRGELRPYQKAGYDWLHFLHRYGFGGCLADDMGTGKTIQTLSFLLSLREADPLRPADLVVMPRSLLFNWQREAAQFAPALKVHIHADQGRISDPAEFGQHDLVLTTYGVMLRDIELLRKYQFGYAVLDESQAVKNPLGETSRAARTLSAQGRLVLTGTPVENTTLELWSQFAFINPGLLGSLDYFREEFAAPIERRQDAAAAAQLRRLVNPFILRRTKDQVALDLPPRSEELLLVDMEPAQRRAYNKTRDQYRAQLLKLIDSEGMDEARLKVLEGLLRLRQICNHPRLVDGAFRGSSGKFELLIETLETLRAEGHKALIFSQFVQMLAVIREALDARQIPYAYLDGATRNRPAEVDRFQSTPELPFFLISLKAGGVGLNLTAADYVIHVDPWWNPAVELQATDRTHRIGQTRPVFVYKLITRGTVEEKILELQERKRALVEQLIVAEGGALKALTRADVEALFS